jgi:hypothetical protein
MAWPTGITVYMKNGCNLETAQHIANDESPGRQRSMTGVRKRFLSMRWSESQFEKSQSPLIC